MNGEYIYKSSIKTTIVIDYSIPIDAIKIAFLKLKNNSVL